MNSNASTLARPYARAAFSLAHSHGRLRPWSSLIAFAAAIAADDRVAALLDHPGIDDDTLVGLLLPEGDVDPTFRQFLHVLAENRRLSVLTEISAQFELMRAQAEQVVRVTVTSAAPMQDAERARLADSLRRRFDREVDMRHEVDPDLLGGAIIDAGDLVIDGSLRGKLSRLQTELAH
ncbi:MAG: F0F1 ATP synthase subunit delta [Lysobacteraceae bacterium]